VATCSKARRWGADECELYWCRYFEEMGYEVYYYGGNKPGYDMMAYKIDEEGNLIIVVYIEVKSGTRAHLSKRQREYLREIMNNPIDIIDHRYKIKYIYAVCGCDCDANGNCVPLGCDYYG
jgi:hypothetical protein